MSEQEPRDPHASADLDDLTEVEPFRPALPATATDYRGFRLGPSGTAIGVGRGRRSACEGRAAPAGDENDEDMRVLAQELHERYARGVAPAARMPRVVVMERPALPAPPALPVRNEPPSQRSLEEEKQPPRDEVEESVPPVRERAGWSRLNVWLVLALALALGVIAALWTRLTRLERSPTPATVTGSLQPSSLSPPSAAPPAAPLPLPSHEPVGSHEPPLRRTPPPPRRPSAPPRPVGPAPAQEPSDGTPTFYREPE